MIVAGIDIGGTKIAIGLITEEGRLLCKAVIPTSASQGLKSGVERISNTLQTLADQHQVTFEGIGIASTGPIDPLTGSIGQDSFMRGWEGTGLVDCLYSRFNRTIVMENDADAAALAECRWGSGKGTNNFIYITISTGIGGGMVFDGKLYRGVNGSHPEVGHHTIDPSGPECICGAHGCWECLASGPSMAAWYQSQNRYANDHDPIDAKNIFQKARAGEELALRTVERESYYLGIGIANLITLFSPECISLGGGLMKSWQMMEEKVYSIIEQNCGFVPYQETKVALASLGPDVNLLGAGLAWFHRNNF